MTFYKMQEIFPVDWSVFSGYKTRANRKGKVMHVTVKVSETEIAKTCRNQPEMLGRLLVEIAAAIHTGQTTPEGREAWAFAVMESITEDYAKDDLEAVAKMVGLLNNAAMHETGSV